MVLIKVECVGLAGNKLKGKGGGEKVGGEEETNTEKLDQAGKLQKGPESNFTSVKSRRAEQT